MSFRVRLVPREGESLSSYQVRASMINHYGAPFAVRKIWRQHVEKQGYIDDLKLPRQTETMTILGELTSLDTNTLLDMTAHRFACGMLPPEKIIAHKLWGGEKPLQLSLTAQQLTRQLRPEGRAVYCPLCLKEGPYHRIQWQSQVFTICHVHKCFLSEMCPKCNEPVGVIDVARGRCRKCMGRLILAPVQVVDENSPEYAVQKALCGWLNREGNEDDLGIPANPLTEPLNALYYVFLGLRACLMADTRRLTRWLALEEELPERLDRAALNVHQQSLLVAGAFKALKDWPTNFHAFLDIIRDTREGTGVQAFGNLYVRHISGDWASFSYIFVQQAFDSYMMGDPDFCASLLKSRRFREHPDLIDHLPFVTLEGAAAMLRMTGPSVGTLVDQGVLHRYNQKASRFVILKKSEVEALDAIWKDTLSLVEVGIRLGIWHMNVPDLVDEGLLVGQKGMGRGGM